MCDIIASVQTDIVSYGHRQFRETCKLLPATRGRKGMEGGEGKHLSSVRHLLPQMTQSDCRESLMERSPFTITVAPVDRLFFFFLFPSLFSPSLSAAPEMPPGRKPSIRRAYLAPPNLQPQPSTRAGLGGELVRWAGRRQRITVRDSAQCRRG